MDKTKMHPDFAKWYSEVELEKDSDRLVSRWEGICDLLESPPEGLAETLLEIVLGFETAPADSALRIPFTDADKFFNASNNDREMAILAEVALCLMCDPGGDYAGKNIVAPKTLAALFPRNVPPRFVTGLPEQIGGYVEQLGESVRSRGLLIPPRAITSVDLSKELESMTDAGLDQLKAMFEGLVKKVNGSISSVDRRITNYAAKVNKHIDQKDEELDILWWLTDGVSHSLDKQIGRLKLGFRAMVVGAELAKMTRFNPGPVGVRGIIQKVCEKSTSKKLTIPEALAACDRSWLGKLVSGEASRLTPINFAIARCMEVGEGIDWVPSWAGICSLDSDRQYTEVEIASQFYSERMALGLYGGDE